MMKSILIRFIIIQLYSPVILSVECLQTLSETESAREAADHSAHNRNNDAVCDSVPRDCEADVPEREEPPSEGEGDGVEQPLPRAQQVIEGE